MAAECEKRPKNDEGEAAFRFPYRPFEAFFRILRLELRL